MQFWTYILRCSDDSYYVGHTDDVERRVAMHQDGSIGGYTSSRRPVGLVYSEVFDSRDDAFLRERQIKGWSRAKKDALIRGEWELLQRLSKRAHPSTSSG
jgi:predicted GIY-YIG superfamily endonuclease